MFGINLDVRKISGVLGSKVKARSRLNNSIMMDRIDVPQQVLELMRYDMFATVNKYFDVDDQHFEMKWRRVEKAGSKNKDEADVEFIEVITRIPLDEKWLKKNECIE